MPDALIGPPAWQVTLGDYPTVAEPSPDGTQLVVGSLAGDAALIETATGDLLVKLTDHPLGVLCAHWSHDGTHLAVGGQDGALHLYNRSGEKLRSIELDGWVADVAWSPTSDSLAVAAGRSVTLLSAAGWRPSTFEPLTSTVTSLAWSPNGKRVGAAAYGGISWYDDDATARGPVRTHAWKGSLLAVVVAPNGKWACAGAQDSSVHLWKLWSGDDLSMSGYPSKIDQLAFRHDSRWMATACLGEITVWDFGRSPARTRPAVGEAHDRHISALCWQPGGELLLTAGADGRLAVWPSPLKQGKQLTPHNALDGEVPASVAAWTGAASVVVGRADGTIEHRHLHLP